MVISEIYSAFIKDLKPEGRITIFTILQERNKKVITTKFVINLAHGICRF